MSLNLNRWVFKWRLKVRMFSHSQQVESSGWMEQQQQKRDGPVRCVCTERPATEYISEERTARGGAWVCTSSLRYVGVAVVRTLFVPLAVCSTIDS